MRGWGIGIVLALGLIGFAACDKGGGEGDGDEPANVTMVATPLAHETATANWNFTMQAPEGAEVNWESVAFYVMDGDWFKVQVTPRDDRGFDALKTQVEGMNVQGHEFLIDEPDTLMYRLDTAEGPEFHVVYKVALADTTVRCESIPPGRQGYTRPQVDRILEACRSLAVATP